MSNLMVSLTDPSLRENSERVLPSRVGGKASSLAKLYATKGLSSNVPKAHALTVDFFSPWIDTLTSSDDFKDLTKILQIENVNHSMDQKEKATNLCTKLKDAGFKLPLSGLQSEAIQKLVDEMNSDAWRVPKQAAVRSSAPEEDGTTASFAGAFETKLGVGNTFQSLEQAIRSCFSSLWDYRVWNYRHQQKLAPSSLGFCVVVMEMVDSIIAGVAFSANPLNSDRDELVIDSSWGLGESVVDGTVTADRYIVDKIVPKGKHGYAIKESTIGHKGSETRIDVAGGTMTRSVKASKQETSSLNNLQIQELTRFVCLVEEAYGMPMDVEWAFVEATPRNGSDEDETEPSTNLELKLLQARSITTLYHLDPKMMTKKGERRRLYFDPNIISEATTTSPFTTLDNDFFTKMGMVCMGVTLAEQEKKQFSIVSDNPNMPYFNADTRQYMNVSPLLNFVGKEKLVTLASTMDPYSASIIASNDFGRKKYRSKRLIPKGINPISTYKFLSTFPMSKMHKVGRKYSATPKEAIESYRVMVAEDMAKLDVLGRKDFLPAIKNKEVCLSDIATEFCMAIFPSLFEEISAINNCILKIFQNLDQQRRDGATEEIKQDYEALCGGFEGDELMEMNIELHRLAQTLPQSIWEEYDHEDMKDLAERIQDERDLPGEFLTEWKSFMRKYGFDGQDQMFISCPRYADKPELLLQKLKLNAIGNSKDPSITAKEQLGKRRAVQARHEEEARRVVSDHSSNSFLSCFSFRKKKKLAEIQKRNALLDHVAWIRNAPKIHLTNVIAKVRAVVLLIEKELIRNGRLKEEGDIFHLNMKEIDKAMLEKEGSSKAVDLMEIVRPRKAVYKRALASNMCPLFVDSRCRILQPDPPARDGRPPAPGTLVGSAISPGVASGKVRIIHSPSDRFEPGEILCAVVTGPAWTPLFATAAAVVLQIGGVLQHGALCAREYGKPAVSNIDINTLLENGMMVEVDGNSGIVKILGDGTDSPGVSSE